MLGKVNTTVTALLMKVKVKFLSHVLTLCDPMDWSPPGSSVHGILQARVLEWISTAFSRGSSQPRDRLGTAGQVTDAL